MLTCQICGYTHPTMIHFRHIRDHGLSTQEYKERFPGHPLRIQTEESKQKASASKKGVSSPFRGVTRGPNERLSAALKGKPRPNTRGLKRTDEQRKRISEKTREAMVGKMTDEIRKKLCNSIANRKAIGTYVAPMQGKTVSEESKAKIRESLERINKAKSKEIIDSFTTVAQEQNLTVTLVENNYWFSFKCNVCSTPFTFSRQVFRQSAKGGNDLCPTCYPRSTGSSNIEKEVYEFVKSVYAGIVIPNDRGVLGGKEIDVYCPDLKLGFEFTGLYWHAQKQNPENKHLLWKTQFAFKEGVTLVTIFEDEWILKKDIVKSRIMGLLGLHTEKIFARKCEIRTVAPKEKNEFLLLNHIQGKDASSINLGLYHNDTLVSLATFKKTNIVKGGNGSSWELSRFCSKIGNRIVGGAGKLITHFMQNYNTQKLQLVSYADSRWSKGKLYATLGFEFAGASQPSYWYTKDYKQRVHRSALMKHRLVKCEEDKLLTEWQLAQQQGYDRIWDCGTTKWVLKYYL